MAPLAVAMVINFVVFGFVLRSLHRSIVQHRKRSSFGSVPQKQRQDFKKTRATVALVCLLGLAWLFGGLISPGDPNAGLAFQYLFALFVTLQGFGIFLFHCPTRPVSLEQPIFFVVLVLAFLHRQHFGELSSKSWLFSGSMASSPITCFSSHVA